MRFCAEAVAGFGQVACVCCGHELHSTLCIVRYHVVSCIVRFVAHELQCICQGGPKDADAMAPMSTVWVSSGWPCQGSRRTEQSRGGALASWGGVCHVSADAVNIGSVGDIRCHGCAPWQENGANAWLRHLPAGVACAMSAAFSWHRLSWFQ